MLSRSQVIKLVFVSLALWIAATLYIRLFSAAMLDPVMGSLSFATTLVFAWLSIVIIRRAASLSQDQLVGGVSVVGAVAMMIDGAILRGLPSVYGDGDTVVRLGAAWLLLGLWREPRDGAADGKDYPCRRALNATSIPNSRSFSRMATIAPSSETVGLPTTTCCRWQ